MIKAEFARNGGNLIGFMITGHAGTAEYGHDLVCAAVTSSVMLTVNTITDFLEADAKVEVKENSIALRLNKPNENIDAVKVLQSLKAHLEIIGKENGGITVQVKDTERN